MALQTNRQQSLVNSGKKIKTVAEYLEPLLAANIPLEEIEELLTEEVAELESKLRETTELYSEIPGTIKDIVVHYAYYFEDETRYVVNEIAHLISPFQFIPSSSLLKQNSLLDLY